MSTERWDQLSDLFAQAVECPPTERQLFLDRVCQGDEELRRELESLLSNDAAEQRLADIPAEFVASCADNREAESDMAGRRIGPYRLISLIGHGGMGAVYLGVRDDDQYQKQVAIKLLKRGLDTDFMLSRFRQERQILANLEHPFIARMMDGGATEDGLPYFVMEYVDGVPITKYCSDNSLSIPERLRLFRLVCEAVQYAHQNLVVHRDIKPSNILTTKEGIPKLLDFGIAKVLDPDLAGNVTFTQRELRMLTPDYASPEQVRGLPIGTATDIYSLGAVLYELIASSRPHRFTTGSAAEVERAICETELEKPSSVAARNDQFVPSIRKQLSRRLSGDLDNIVLTAMRKEPQRRYASAAEFSEDLRRHMEALPVLAREPRWTYRAGKFIRRNRLTVCTTVLVAASLVGGIIATSIQVQRAESRFELARQLAKSMVADIKGPMAQLPGATSLRASMIRTVLRYLDGLAQDPGRDPAFELEIADAYREVASVEGNPLQQNLGQTAAALEHYQKAIAIYARLANRPETRGHALAGLIGTSIQAGDVERGYGNAAAAKTRFERVAALAAEAAARDTEAVRPGTWMYLYFRLGRMEMEDGAPDRALVHFKKGVEVCQPWDRAERTPETRTTLHGAYNQFAEALKEAGDLYNARKNYEAAFRVVEDAIRQPNATVYERSMLAYAHQTVGNLMGNPDDLNFGDRPLAISRVRTSIRMFETIAASDPADMRARDDLAAAWRSLGAILLEEEPAEALKAYQKATALSEELRAPNPANTRHQRGIVRGQMGIGESLLRIGRSGEALSKLNRALELARSLTGVTADKPRLTGEIGRLHRDLGDVLLSSGDESGALENYRQALALTNELTQRAPANAYFRRQRADSLESLGRYYARLARSKPELRTEARQWFQKSLAVWQDLKRRNVGAPYTRSREVQLTALIASIDHM